MSDLKPPPSHPGKRSPSPARGPSPVPGEQATHRRLPPRPDTSTPPPPLPSQSRTLPPPFDSSIQPAPSPAPTLSAHLDPDSYIRDPHKLIAYVVPFPAPVLNVGKDVPPPPLRFLIYTPPPPPLLKPVAETDKEKAAQKVQRKWQEEVRAAHTSTHKVTSWGGIRAKVTRGVHWAVGQVTSADLDFLTRVPVDGDPHRGSGRATPGQQGNQTKAEADGAASTSSAPGHIHPVYAPPLQTSQPSPYDTTGAKAREAAQESHDAAEALVPPPPYSDPVGDVTDTKGKYTIENPPPLPPRHSVDASSTANPTVSAGQAGSAVQDTHTKEASVETAAPAVPADDDILADTDTAPTQATVKLEEMVLIYPPSMHMTPEEIKVEFVNSLMRTKSKAQRDAIIATGLLPVATALDWALCFVGWVFGGLLEVDAVWAAASFRGAKTARSVTRRLASTSSSGDAANSSDMLRLTFTASHRADPLQAYLRDLCVGVDHRRFEPDGSHPPTAAEVLDAVGWEASGAYERQNWEDEKWERDQVEADLKTTMGKAAKAWARWCERYEKNPEKAIRK